MLTPDKLERLNELARKKKSNQALTASEKQEQESLRNEYIQSLRSGLKQQIEGIQFVDKEGNDVTPQKIKAVQKERGLRDTNGRVIESTQDNDKK